MRAVALPVSLVLSLLASTVAAQTYTAPAAPPIAAPAGAAAPGAGGLWGCVSSCCTSAKNLVCNGPLGLLLKNALAPLSALTGGMVPGCGPSQQALNAPGAAGAAAGIQADQAGAKARVAAVRFLGTVDCHWYPEAEAALVAALRADRSECVRFEAAKSLARGCCCTKTTIEALSICVTGSEKDGNPSENSLRVQLVALEGLQRCVSTYRGEVDEKEQPRPEQPAGANGELAQAGPVTDLPPIHLSAYYSKVKRAPREDVLANAKKVVTTMQSREVATPDIQRRRGSVYEIWKQTQ